MGDTDMGSKPKSFANAMYYVQSNQEPETRDHLIVACSLTSQPGVVQRLQSSSSIID